jgi:hypothetical protein
LKNTAHLTDDELIPIAAKLPALRSAISALSMVAQTQVLLRGKAKQ